MNSIKAKINWGLKYNLVVIIKPETKWSNHEQVETMAATHCEGLNSCMWKNTETICG